MRRGVYLDLVHGWAVESAEHQRHTTVIAVVPAGIEVRMCTMLRVFPLPAALACPTCRSTILTVIAALEGLIDAEALRSLDRFLADDEGLPQRALNFFERDSRATVKANDQGA